MPRAGVFCLEGVPCYASWGAVSLRSGFSRSVAAPGGSLAVVDFHGSRHGWFRRWMQANHVRMDEHLLPVLKAGFYADMASVRPAYGGLWQYFLFLGRRRGGPGRRWIPSDR